MFAFPVILLLMLTNLMYCVHLSLCDCQHLSSELNLACDHSGARNTNRQLQDMQSVSG